MARRQYFTVDEALSQLPAEEDDFLFGTGDSDSSGEDYEEDFRQAQSLVTPHSADRQAALEAFYTHFSYFQFTERSYPKKQQPERWMGMLSWNPCRYTYLRFLGNFLKKFSSRKQL